MGKDEKIIGSFLENAMAEVYSIGLEHLDRLKHLLYTYDVYKKNLPKYEIDVEADIKNILIYDVSKTPQQLVEEIPFTSWDDFDVLSSKYDATLRFLKYKNKLKKK